MTRNSMKRTLILIAAGMAMATFWIVVVLPVACVGGAVLSGARHESEAGAAGAPYLMAAAVIGMLVIPFALHRLALRLDRGSEPP
jgi:hypothetical protein